MLQTGAGHGLLELTLLARACANQGQLQEAHRWCEAAIYLDKCDPGLRYLQAMILEEQGCAEAAAVSLQRALYLDQDFILAHFALGNLYRRQGRPTEAARHFGNARGLLQNYPAAQILPESGGMAAGRLMEMIHVGARPV